MAYHTSGSVDEVRIYNRVLTKAEIDSLAHPLHYASIGNKSITEGNAGTQQMNFLVKLNNPSDKTIKINYATKDGTAKAGSDYVAKSGTITFLPGITQKGITIAVKGDIKVESDERFNVVLSNPRNVIISDSIATGKIIDDDVAFSSISNNSKAKPNIEANLIVNLYPNPTRNISTLLISGNNKPVTIIISDLSGRVLYTQQNVIDKSLVLPLQNFVNGVYIVSVSDGAKKKILKLIK